MLGLGAILVLLVHSPAHQVRMRLFGQRIKVEAQDIRRRGCRFSVQPYTALISSIIFAQGAVHAATLGRRSWCWGFLLMACPVCRQNLSQVLIHMHSKLHTQLHERQVFMTGFPPRGSWCLRGTLTSQGD